MPSRSLAAIISCGFGLVSALRVAHVWDRLPERMASHYNASGQPDGFMMRSDFFIFYAGIFGLVILLFMTMPNVLSYIPRELVNIPHREFWLTDERWPQAVDLLGRWMAWFGVGLAVLAAAVLQLVLRSNLAHQPLENTAMWCILCGFFVLCGYWLIGLQRAFRPPA